MNATTENTERKILSYDRNNLSGQKHKILSYHINILSRNKNRYRHQIKNDNIL